jgi:threonine/homoserine/homoserine lactone efflux protein
LFISFVIFAIIAAVTPGPNNVMLTTTGLNFGVRRGMPHLLGIAIGFPVMLALIGLGFGTLFQLFPLLHEVIKIVGVILPMPRVRPARQHRPSRSASGNRLHFNGSIPRPG